MKDDYIASLNRALMFYQIENKDEILKKYEKRYDFGIESELSEKEIEEMLGNPTEIAKELAEKKPVFKDEYTDKVECKANYNLIVKTVNDNIVIRRSNDDKIHTYLDNTEMSAYNLKNNENDGVIMAYKTGSWFSLNRKHNGAIEIDIPENVVFDKIEITSQVGKIVVEIPLEGNNVKIDGASSTGDFGNIKANNLYIHSVTGDMKFNNINSAVTKILTVSGDVKISEIDGNEINAETISGDIFVEISNARTKTSSITGRIVIGESNTKNLKTKAKEFFKR